MARAGGLREDKREALKCQNELWGGGCACPLLGRWGWGKGVSGLRDAELLLRKGVMSCVLGTNSPEQSFSRTGTDKVGTTLKDSQPWPWLDQPLG